LKGTYILIIDIAKSCKIKVGKLGKISFDKGIYAYVGSALNNLESRIKRHFSKRKKKFWHIDFLLSKDCANIKGFFWKMSKYREECKIAKKLEKVCICKIPNFGSSDCRCESHLFRLGIEKEKLGNILGGFNYATKPFA